MTRRTFAALLGAQAPADRREILAAMERVMGALPAGYGGPLDVAMGEEKDEPEFTRRHLTYSGGDGDRVTAWLLVPRRKGRLPAALCLHQTTKIGKDEPAGLGGNPDLHYAKELAARGFVTLAPDYPNFGGYSFDPYVLGYASATRKGIANHQRALDVLTGLETVDASRIAAVGHSLGGHNALFLAAFDARVRAVVTSCGFTAFRRYYNGDLTGWSHRGYMPRIATEYGKDPARMPFDFSDVLAAIAPRGVFINAPLQDTNFAVAGVKETVAAVEARFPGKKLRVEYPDAGHSFPPSVREQAWRFLEADIARG